MTYRVSIVGAGIGTSHLAGFWQLRDRFTVANVCDLNTARAEALVAQYPGVAVTDDLAGVIADPEIDIVDVCLPPHLHFQTCLDALAAGKHVICEKPLVTSLEGGGRAGREGRGDGAKHLPRLPVPLRLGTAQLRALRDAGLAGAATRAASRRIGTGTPPTTPSTGAAHGRASGAGRSSATRSTSTTC